MEKERKTWKGTFIEARGQPRKLSINESQRIRGGNRQH